MCRMMPRVVLAFTGTAVLALGTYACGEDYGTGYWAGDASQVAPEEGGQSEPASYAEEEVVPSNPPAAPQQVQPVPVRVVPRTSAYVPASVPITNQGRQVLSFYGGQSAVATLNQMPRRTPIESAAAPSVGPRGKAFQNASNGPTVSPYLNLFRDENENTAGLPNYYAFVRPQLEQQENALRQQRDMQQLQRQMKQAAAGSRRYQSSGQPGEGTPARFMDTAQYYSGWRR